jgi:hypothetical protein
MEDPTILYDRVAPEDIFALVPFPDDFWLVDDAVSHAGEQCGRCVGLGRCRLDPNAVSVPRPAARAPGRLPKLPHFHVLRVRTRPKASPTPAVRARRAN